MTEASITTGKVIVSSKATTLNPIQTTWPTARNVILGTPFKDGEIDTEDSTGVPPWVVYLLCAIAAFACLGLFLFIYFWGFSKTEQGREVVSYNNTSNRPPIDHIPVTVNPPNPNQSTLPSSNSNPASNLNITTQQPAKETKVQVTSKG